jgi:hypothetical protein
VVDVMRSVARASNLPLLAPLRSLQRVTGIEPA